MAVGGRRRLRNRRLRNGEPRAGRLHDRRPSAGRTPGSASPPSTATGYAGFLVFSPVLGFIGEAWELSA
jgi:hypothetical protein